jgi:hypothetical protein
MNAVWNQHRTVIRLLICETKNNTKLFVVSALAVGRIRFAI